MIITSPEVRRTVFDYDFNFMGGSSMSLTLDEVAGDTFTEVPEMITVYLTEKPSRNNPDSLLPAERIVIYKQHVISIQSRQREVLELSPEEKFELKQTIHQLTGSVN